MNSSGIISNFRPNSSNFVEEFD